MRRHMLEATGVEGGDIGERLDREFGLLEQGQLSDKALMNRLKGEADSSGEYKEEALQVSVCVYVCVHVIERWECHC